jgi:acyl-CoA thioesterase FadM
MKHEAWRHDPAAYGSTQPVAARFADVDTRRHVNNIAVYGLHHEARQRRLMAAGGGAVWPDGSLLLKPRASRTEFWQECHYPAPIDAPLRLLQASPTGLTLAGGLFQGGVCVGMQQSHLGAWAPDLSTPAALPAAWLAALADSVRPVGDLANSPAPTGSGQRLHYPVAATLASRYGDFDADGGTSEAAVMRGIEQARAALLKAAFAVAGGQPERDWVSLLVARIDLHFVHHRAPPAHWALAAAVTHTGRSSAVLRVAMFDGQTLQATADCVMVYTDPAGPPGAAPLPPALRAALQSFHWLLGDTPCP